MDETPFRLAERGRIFDYRYKSYSAVYREPPPPWGGKPGMWGLLKSGLGYCKSMAGKVESLNLKTLIELAAYYYVLDATGQKISKATARKISIDMDFGYRGMLPEEMVALYAKHQPFDFT